MCSLESLAVAADAPHAARRSFLTGCVESLAVPPGPLQRQAMSTAPAATIPMQVAKII